MQTQTIRRHANGSINYDYYHNQALMLRAETMTDFFRAFAAIKKPVMLLVVIAAAIVAVRPDQYIG